MRIHWSRFVILLLGMLAITACGSHTAASASFSSAVVTQATHTGTHRPDRPSVSPSDSTQRPRTTPLTLTVTPSMGPANSLVTLQLTSPKPPPGGVANICWGGCGASSYTTGVRFHRVGSHLYTGTTRLPGGWMALPGGFARVLKKGVYSLSVTCLTSQPACAYHPEASTTFRLTHRAVVAAWSQLPRGTWHAVPTLEALPLASGVTATDANSPGRRVTCHPAPLQAGQPSSAALIVTGPDPFRAPLSAQVFGSVSGEVACRAVALDPHDVNTIYAAGAIDPGSNGPLAFPPPVYSTDRGHKWQRVPTPAGLSSPADFVGFTESPHGVTAWFSPAATPWALNPVGRITGEMTGDGGQHWHQVSLACPATGPCAWQVNTFLMDSRDHGQSWHVASFRSNSLHGLAYWGPDQALTLFEPHLVGLPISQYPLLRSTDGGARWAFVSLPAPPGGWIPVSYAGQAFMAQNGALVAQESDGSGGTTWIELPPGGSHWRRISGSSVPRSAQGQGQ